MMFGFQGISSSVHNGIEDLVNSTELKEYVVLVDHEFSEKTNLFKVVKQCPSCVWDFEHKNGMINSEEFAYDIVKSIENLMESAELNDPNDPKVKIAVFKVRAETVQYHRKSRTLYYCDIAFVKLSDPDSDDDLGPGIPEEAIMKEEIDEISAHGPGSCTLL